MIRHVNTCDNWPLGANGRPTQRPFEPGTTVLNLEKGGVILIGYSFVMLEVSVKHLDSGLVAASAQIDSYH